MAVLTDSGVYNASFVVSEGNHTISRDQVTVTVPANTTLQAGTVLAKLTATGKYVEYDNSGGDGSEEAAGILRSAMTNDDDAPADGEGVVINYNAEVRRSGLIWKTGLVDADKDAGIADLLNLGIKVRD